jgi:hypothetical protein
MIDVYVPTILYILLGYVMIVWEIVDKEVELGLVILVSRLSAVVKWELIRADSTEFVNACQVQAVGTVRTTPDQTDQSYSFD